MANIEYATPAIPSVKNRHGYLPTLDGWRAIAIAMVLIDHYLTTFHRSFPSVRLPDEYLVQQGGLGVLQDFPWNLPALFAIVLVSFYGIEKPLIRLGHRLAQPVTPGRRDVPT